MRASDLPPDDRPDRTAGSSSKKLALFGVAGVLGILVIGAIAAWYLWIGAPAPPGP